MSAVGPSVPFYVIVGAWLVKIMILSLICTFLGWLGVKVMDALTPRIHKREMLGANPLSVGLFIAGFFIFLGLVIHGALTAPTVILGPSLAWIIDYQRLSLIGVSFFVSLLLGIGLFNLVDRLTPQIPFIKIKENPVAVGLDVFGYLVFFGLIIHAALTMPL